MNNGKLVRFIAQFGVLLAILAIFCFTPLGSLPAIGPIVATLAMIPVVVTAILMGTGAGVAMGAFAGLFSFLVWTFAPPNPLIAFVFTPFTAVGSLSGNFGSVLICFVPRIVVGFTAGALCELFDRVMPKKPILSYSISAAAGSFVNTVGVVAGMSLFFGSQLAELNGATMLALAGVTILFSGIPEAVVAAVVASAICRPLKKGLKR